MNQKANANGKPPAETGQAVTELDGAELNDRKREHISEIKTAEAAFLELIAHLAPNGNTTRELSLARTKVEEAAMWAIKGVVAQ